MNDPLQLHLFFNHAPLIGGLAALLVVLIGVFTRNNAVRMAGIGVYIVMALAVVPTYLTGEGAEDKVESIAGISKDAIEEHEEHGELALWLMIAAAVFGACAFVAQWKSTKASITTALTTVFIAVAVAAFIKVAITAHEGGKIRRPDLGSPAASGSANEVEKADGDKD